MHTHLPEHLFGKYKISHKQNTLQNRNQSSQNMPGTIQWPVADILDYRSKNNRKQYLIRWSGINNQGEDVSSQFMETEFREWLYYDELDENIQFLCQLFGIGSVFFEWATHSMEGLDMSVPFEPYLE